METPKVAGEEHLQPRARDLFRASALPLGKEKKDLRSITKCYFFSLKGQESLRELLSVYQIAVLDSIYEIIYAYPDLNGVRIAALTEQVNANLQQRGESGNLSPKRVGDVLTSLPSDGPYANECWIYFELDRKTREEIHSIAHKYAINDGSTPEQAKQCELCQALSQHAASGSTAKPVKNRARARANGRREHSERGEPKKRRVRRKPPRGRARLRISRPEKPASPKPRRYFIKPHHRPA